MSQSSANTNNSILWSTRRVVLSLAILALFSVSAGCGGHAYKKPRLLMTRSDAVRCAEEAQTAPSANARLKAVRKLSSSRYGDEPMSARALCKVARDDTSERVRKCAVRRLAATPIPETVATMLVLVGAEVEGLSAEPASVRLKWEVLSALEAIAAEGEIPEELVEGASGQACLILLSEPDRDLRVAAARVLGWIPTSEAVEALVESIGQRDFGVVYESERSLMRLTGKSHDYSQQRWREWLGSTEDWLAERGRLDGELDPPKKRWYWPFKNK